MVYIPNGLWQNGSKLVSNGSKYVANVNLQGILGFMPRLDLIDASTPQVMRQANVVVASVPTLFQKIPNGVVMFKTIMESFVQNITGIDVGYTLETSGYPAGNDGQQLLAPLDAKRSPISPSFTFPEIVGNVIYNFMKNWMFMIRSPDTQASALAGLIDASVELPPHTISSYAADLLILQYDTTLRPENMIDGFMITNLFPTDIGTFGLQKEMGQSVRPDRTIQFSGIIQHNASTKAMAISVANLYGLHRVDPDSAPAVVSDANAIVANSGLKAGVDAIINKTTPSTLS